MKMELLCKKDWILEGVTHFSEGHYYKGTFKKDYPRKGINTFITKSKDGVKGNFYSGSDYFDI